MIRINLLPAELESAPSYINPAIPLSAAFILPSLICVFIQARQISVRNGLRVDVASIRSDLERYQPIIAQVEALEAAKVQLTQRKSVIQQLERERLRYPQFFDDFVKLLPSNLWLTNLATTSQPASDSMTVNMDVIALDNYAIADLIANLETSQIFTDVDMGAIGATASPIGGQQMSFRVTTNYKKVGPVPDAAKKS